MKLFPQYLIEANELCWLEEFLRKIITNLGKWFPRYLWIPKI